MRSDRTAFTFAPLLRHRTADASRRITAIALDTSYSRVFLGLASGHVEEHQLLAKPATDVYASSSGAPGSTPAPGLTRLTAERRISKHAVLVLACMPSAARLAILCEDGSAAVAAYDTWSLTPLPGVKTATAIAADPGPAAAAVVAARRPASAGGAGGDDKPHLHAPAPAPQPRPVRLAVAVKALTSPAKLLIYSIAPSVGFAAKEPAITLRAQVRSPAPTRPPIHHPESHQAALCIAHQPPHRTTQHSTTQHNTAQHSTAQHSTAQHSTAQRSTAPLRDNPHDHRRMRRSQPYPAASSAPPLPSGCAAGGGAEPGVGGPGAVRAAARQLPAAPARRQAEPHRGSRLPAAAHGVAALARACHRRQPRPYRSRRPHQRLRSGRRERPGGGGAAATAAGSAAVCGHDAAADGRRGRGGAGLRAHRAVGAAAGAGQLGRVRAGRHGWRRRAGVRQVCGP